MHGVHSSCEPYFCRYHAHSLEMVHDLVGLQSIKRDVAPFESEFQVETRGIVSGIFYSASLFEGLADALITACNDKHLGVRRKPVLLYPVIHTCDVIEISIFGFS